MRHTVLPPPRATPLLPREADTTLLLRRPGRAAQTTARSAKIRATRIWLQYNVFVDCKDVSILFRLR